MKPVLAAPGPVRRRWRRSTAEAVSALLLVALMPVPAAAASPAAGGDVTYWRGVNPVTNLTAETFMTPPANDFPWVRWNWQPANTTIAQIEQALQDLASVGVAGVEIGQGGNPTNEQLVAVLTKANELNIKVSLKYTGGAPVSGTWDQANDYTRVTLSNDASVVAAGSTFSGLLPGTGTIVAVLAYRCSDSPCATTGIQKLERSSVVDLTSQITGTDTAGYYDGTTTGSLSWTAPASPAGSEWVLMTFRAVAFQNAPELLSKQGTAAMIAGYEQLWTPEIKSLLKANGGDIFVDSHTTDPWGTATELWSSNIRTEFQSRVGYSLVPNLAALFYSRFSYSDGSDERIRSDFYGVRNDLFIQNRVTPFTEWANGLGLTLRLQNEDPDIATDSPFQDQIDVAYNLDRPEHESLSGGDQIDLWRPMVSANHWNGNPWFSFECCAVRTLNYADTLESVMVRMNKAYAGGITKMIHHVYPGESTPTSTFPGYSNFSPTSFSSSWGPRNPNWASDARTANEWMARNQQVLTQGRADMDVAVYLHSYEWPTYTSVNTDGSAFGNRQWDDRALQRAGYTWDYVNPTMLNSTQAKVRGGVLAADGPSYKALVVNSDLNTPRHPLKTSMRLDTAKQILEFAEDGLPVIIVGDAPDQTPGNNGNDSELRKVIADILDQPSVYRVASEAGVPAKLAALGVQPDAKPSERSSMLSLHRADDATGTDYYFLYNQGFDEIDNARSRYTIYEESSTCSYTGSLAFNPCNAHGSAIDIDVTLKGSGTPYILDATSGVITPIAEYTTRPGSVTVHVALDRDDSTIIALARPADRFGKDVPALHVEETSAESAAVVGQTIVVRDSQAGDQTVKLSDGTTLTAEIGQVPASLDLTDAQWELKAEDWKPANALGTTGAEGSAITKNPVTLELDGLKPWSQIPELKNSSGVGTYTTTFAMAGDWDPTSSAQLSIGQAVDTVALSVNGAAVPVNQISGIAEVGPYLHAGDNEIAIRVSTNLNNLLSDLLTAVKSRGLVEDYGLVGPVVLSPSGQAVVYQTPVKSAIPTISGNAVVGDTLTVDGGTWSPQPVALSYQWLVDGSVIPGATEASYTLAVADQGHRISVEVTGSKIGYQSASARSAETVAVAQGRITNTVAPVITGKAKVGHRLYASTGSWSPEPSKYSYRWYRNGKAIKGATSATYKLTRADKGKKVKVKVTAKLVDYVSASKTSQAVGPVKR